MNAGTNEKDTRRKLIKAIAISLPVLSVIAVLEVVLRFLGPEYYQINNTSSEYYSNPRGYHVPVRKEGRHIIYSLPYRQSPEGFRLPDDEYLQAGTENGEIPGILTIGDSFTWGRGVKYEDIYTTRLFNMLKKDGYRPYVKNCGKGGANIEEIAEIHARETSQKKYPVIIYGFVLNDFGKTLPVITGSDFIDSNNGFVRFRVVSYLNSIRKISKTFNLLMFCIEKYRLNTVTTSAYLDAFKGKTAQEKFSLIADMNRKTKQKGGELVIMIFPLLYDFDSYPFREIHKKIASFCAKEKIPLLDLFSCYSMYKDHDLWANPTDHHPNEIAHKLTAERLYDFLIEQKLVIKEGAISG